MQEDLLIRESSLDNNYSQIVEYPDTYSLNGEKLLKIKNLGERFAYFNLHFLDFLKEYHIPSAFVKIHNKNGIKFTKHSRLQFYIRILNITDKRTSKLFSLKESEPLNLPIFEVHFGLGKDTLISDSHLIAFDLCSNEDLKIIYRICSKVNAVLKSYFERRNYLLAEVNCYFGKYENKIFLVDDFTPRSLKILPFDRSDNFIDPYRLSTVPEVRHYTENLYNLTRI